MTDKEITEIIATKVMGWALASMDNETIFRKDDTDDGIVWPEDFEPLTSDTHLGITVDEFAKQIGTLHVTTGYSPKHDCIMTEAYAVLEGNEYCVGTTMNKDRRRAMCECMVRATIG